MTTVRFSVGMEVLGLDVSLTGLGVCLAWGDAKAKLGGSGALQVESACIRLGEDYRGVDRVQRLLAALEGWYGARVAVGASVRVAVLEGYGFSSQRAHSLGEIGGVAKLWLWEKRIPFIIVPPSTLKKFATGIGNGDKNVMLKKVYQRWGFDVDEDNECDAFCCAMLGLRSLVPPSTMTAYELELFSKKVERWDRNATQDVGKIRGKSRKVAGSTSRRRAGRADDRPAVQQGDDEGPQQRLDVGPGRLESARARLRVLDP